ncbi:MAG: hypothetical protein ACYCU5_12965, partial [Actinomycetes bacterium]
MTTTSARPGEPAETVAATVVLLAAVAAPVLVVGSLTGSWGLTVAVVVVVLTGVGVVGYSDRWILWMVRAHPVVETQAPRLFRLVAEVSAAAGTPVPRVYLSPLSAPT